MAFDVFISHASEDKAAVALPLAKRLQELGIKVWIDEFALQLGDSLSRSIDRGLSESRFGVVILSPNFLRKEWPKRELDSLVAREDPAGERMILPVWHEVTPGAVREFSPILADRLAVSTSKGIDEVAKTLAEAILLRAQRDTERIVERLQKEPESEVDDETPDEVFVVHGHDLAARESVCRFIEKIGARAIVLDEIPGGGKTIIEKFEDNSHVKFAVVLLTPDDIASAASKPKQKQFRARQNVVFELGYFLGKLGRDRFCILHKGDLELPSDINGVGYIELDSAHGWRIHLARELKRAGVKIDLNNVLD